MAYDGVPTPTIAFFKALYPVLSHSPLCLADMARLASMSPQGSRRHRIELTKRRYLKSDDFKYWYLNPMALRHPFDSLVA